MNKIKVTDFGFDSKNIYTPFNVPCAIKYINKVCYCADDYESLVENIKIGYKVRLKEVCYKDGIPASHPFKVEPVNGGLRNNYRFIIPEEHVNILLSYKAFKDYKQFVDETLLVVGDVITIRRKLYPNIKLSTCITGLAHNEKTGYDALYLGTGECKDFSELFRDFELKNDRKNVWTPFGSCKDGE